MTPAIARSILLAASSMTLAFAGAAAAQAPYADGITVYGHRGVHRLPNGEPELSRRVSYADLDLTTPEGQAELNWRIDDTAQSLCARLGEPPERDQNTAVLPSCQAAARQSAYGQVRRAIDYARYQPPPAPYWVEAQPAPAAYAPAPWVDPAPATTSVSTTVSERTWIGPTPERPYWQEVPSAPPYASTTYYSTPTYYGR